jgi:Rha family phage regulatory protein
MDNLVTVYSHQLVTDSRQVAEHFGKRHDHVMRDINSLVKGLPKNGDTQRMFFKASYTNEQNMQTYPMYYMNRDGFSLLVMGFTGAKALEWKLKFLEAFNAMEKAIKTPQITPNPHYRTRMIKTAVKDAADTAAMIAATFGVKKPMAMTAAMQMVGKAYGVDMTPLKQFIPSESNPSTLTPTMIAKELGILNSKGNPSPQRVNSLLKEIGLQESVGGHWHATEEGKKLSEAMPYTASSGHSGYQLLWSPKVIPMLRDLLAKGGD